MGCIARHIREDADAAKWDADGHTRTSRLGETIILLSEQHFVFFVMGSMLLCTENKLITSNGRMAVSMMHLLLRQ